MSCLPLRAPRVHLAGTTPAVLRFDDGQHASGKLEVVSLTGGLLSLPNPLSQGSQVKLMFLTRAGSVLGGAEMLSPVNSELQPFRFVSLAPNDRRRLGAEIQSGLFSAHDERWIEKFRAASVQTGGSPKHLITAGFRAIALATLGLATTIYLLHTYCFK
jgi:hypothetical protein